MNFDFALRNTLAHEGYYANHPEDRGGETWRGIARNYHPKWEGWEIVDSTDDKKSLEKNNELENLVHDFYFKNFWGSLQKIHDTQLAARVFDCEVLFGKKQGVKLLQRALNVLRHETLKVDGVLGSKTEYAVNTYEHIDSLIYTFVGEVYIKIRNRQKVFRRGWINRLCK